MFCLSVSHKQISVHTEILCLSLLRRVYDLPVHMANSVLFLTFLTPTNKIRFSICLMVGIWITFRVLYYKKNYVLSSFISSKYHWVELLDIKCVQLYKTLPRVHKLVVLQFFYIMILIIYFTYQIYIFLFKYSLTYIIISLHNTGERSLGGRSLGIYNRAFTWKENKMVVE